MSLIPNIPNEMLLSVVLGGTLLSILSFYVIGLGRKIEGKDSRYYKVFSERLWIKSPLLKSEWLSQAMGDDCRVNVKLEALQPSGSFKIRGISTFMKQQYALNANIDTFITTSSANAGMAVAYTAQKLNCKCLVILDKTQNSNELLPVFADQYHAKIEFHGNTWNEADEYALRLVGAADDDQEQQASARKHANYCYVPMYDNVAIFNGHSSIISELADDYADGLGGDNDIYPDCIVVSVGGGGLLTGILSGLFQVGWSRQVKIVAAQCENSALYEAGKQNSFEPVPTKCISSEGVDLGYRAICKKAMTFGQKFESFNPIKSMLVRDEDALSICTLFAKNHHVVIEPLCGVAIAALYNNREYFKQFKNICVIVCGGNHIYFQHETVEQLVGVQNFASVTDEEEDEEKKDGSDVFDAHDEDDDVDDIDHYDSDAEDI